MTVQSLVQAKASASGSSSNVPLAFTNAVTQGDLLVAAVAYTAPTGQPTISDTQTNTWVEVGAISSVYNGAMVTLILFWTLAGATGSCTVTANVSEITDPSSVWMVIGEFTGANSFAIYSGSLLGFGVNPPWDGSSLSDVIQATNPPLTTPTNALLIAVATTSQAEASPWQIDPLNNYFTMAAQSNGIALAFATDMYAGAPFCDMTPPRPILDRNPSDTSVQWCMLTAPFTTTILPPNFPNAVPAPNPINQFPPYPYEPYNEE